MNVFSIQVPIHATLYVRAETESAALHLARQACLDAALEISTRSTGDIEISGLQYADPDLPDVSFSPAMTVGEVPDQVPELVEEGVIDDLPQPPAPESGIKIDPDLAHVGKDEVFFISGEMDGRAHPPLCSDGCPPMPGYWIDSPLYGWSGPFRTAEEAKDFS